MYQIHIEKRGQKDLKKLDKRYQLKVKDVFNQLRVDPFVGEKMSGEYKGYYRVKIPPLRIIYRLDVKKKEIRIYALGHRGDIYK